MSSSFRSIKTGFSHATSHTKIYVYISGYSIIVRSTYAQYDLPLVCVMQVPPFLQPNVVHETIREVLVSVSRKGGETLDKVHGMRFKYVYNIIRISTVFSEAD